MLEAYTEHGHLLLYLDRAVDNANTEFHLLDTIVGAFPFLAPAKSVSSSRNMPNGYFVRVRDKCIRARCDKF